MINDHSMQDDTEAYPPLTDTVKPRVARLGATTVLRSAPDGVSQALLDTDRQTVQVSAKYRNDEEDCRRTDGPNRGKARLAMIGGALTVVIAGLAFVAITCMEMLSAARGYTQAEALWSKGQKDAVLGLMRYAQTRSDADYERFRAAIDIPLACRRVRQQMDLPHYDPAILNHALTEIGIDEKDRSRMVWLYRHLGREPQPAKTIAIWVEAEQGIVALEREAERLRQHIVSHTLEQNAVNETLAETDRINRQLTPLEARFSQSVAEAGYWLHTWLRTMILVIATMLIGAGSVTFWVLLRVLELRGEIAVRRGVQDELLAAKKVAEEASRAKSTFLANMSHELRTPLNAIIGYSQMLHEDYLGPRHEEVCADLEKIERSGHLLLGIINDILDLSKIEAGCATVKSQNVDVALVLGDVCNAVQPLARQQGNKLEIDCPEHALAYADLSKFRQSVLNLVNNACKFTENGRVSVNVNRLRNAQGEWTEVHVSDTGIGIAAEHLGKLFQPFTQVDDSATRRHHGTGLGLAISKQFCQMMGGDITVASEPGRGSRFSIRVPAGRNGGFTVSEK